MAGWMHIAEVALLIAVSYAFGCFVGVLSYRAFVRPRAVASDAATVQTADALVVPAMAAELAPVAVVATAAQLVAVPVEPTPSVAIPIATAVAAELAPPPAGASQPAGSIAAPAPAVAPAQPDAQPVTAPEPAAIRWYAPQPTPPLGPADLLAALADVSPRRAEETAIDPASTAREPLAETPFDSATQPATEAQPEIAALAVAEPPPEVLPQAAAAATPTALPRREDLIAALANVVPRASSDAMAEPPMLATTDSAPPAQSVAAGNAPAAAETPSTPSAEAMVEPAPPNATATISYPSTAEVLAKLAAVTGGRAEPEIAEAPLPSVPAGETAASAAADTVAEAKAPEVAPPLEPAADAAPVAATPSPSPSQSLTPRPARTPGLAWSGLIKGRTSTAFVKRTIILRAPPPTSPAPAPTPATDLPRAENIAQLLTRTVASELALEPESTPVAAGAGPLETPAATATPPSDAPAATRRPPVADMSIAPALAEGLAAELQVDNSAASASPPALRPIAEPTGAPAASSEVNTVPPAPVTTPKAEIGEDDAMRAIEGGSRPTRPQSNSGLGEVGAAVAAAQLAVETVLARSGIDPAAGSDLGKPRGLPRPRNGKRDNLQAIVGLGPLDEIALNNLGIYHFDQVGSWDQRTVLWLENHAFARGRILKEDWQGQARRLTGDISSVQVTR